MKKIDRGSLCLPECGDKITISPWEECDDGNFRNGDGCDGQCQLEADYTCTVTEPSQCVLNLNIT
jgi:cysteine-rich repeat protein